jgi:hypothetical protein
VKSPRFSELSKVRVNDKTNEPYVGYVVGWRFKDGRWIYKISISEDLRATETWDNCVPEEWLKLTK